MAQQKKVKKAITATQLMAIPGGDMPQDLAETMTLSDIFVKSGMFPDVHSQSQAIVKILAGRELGCSPIESITNIYIVKGQIAMMAKLIGALIKRSGKYDYEVTALNNEGCILTFFTINGEKQKLRSSLMVRSIRCPISGTTCALGFWGSRTSSGFA